MLEVSEMMRDFVREVWSGQSLIHNHLNLGDMVVSG